MPRLMDINGSTAIPQGDE